MSLKRNIIIICIIGILLSASAYILIFTNDNEDTDPPQITDITGNFTITAGETASISALFLDNVNVTVATLYYRSADETRWSSMSILDGTVTLPIPSTATENYHYYLIVDDAAGNGPVGDPSTDGSIYYIITVIPANGNGNNPDKNISHTVFIEEATATWCNNCPNVANILSSLYETGSYNFYYVSLIDDKNTKASERLKNDYNVFGFPTVFIDGGYNVIVGGNKPESLYADAISAAQKRTTPNIEISIATTYVNASEEVTATVYMKNHESSSYSGRLKLYITEILSRWSGYDSKQFHYGFVDYFPIQQDITILGGGNLTLTGLMNISKYDYENLMLIGVLFSSEKKQGYANPSDPEDPYPFDAFYTDAANATTIVQGGNLPPQLEITSPKKGKIYLNGNPILERLLTRKLLGSLLNMSLHNTTKLYGQKIITVSARDDSAVTKVEFYIDDSLVFTDTEAPYEYSFTKLAALRSLMLKNHTLKVTVYDDAGKTTSSSLIFKARL